jgi:hypothetical protein
MSLQKKGAGLIQSILLCKDLKVYVKPALARRDFNKLLPC